jgi:DNA-binding CsgD family transcriptional regulator
VAWAIAEELGQRFPLQVIMDCLGFEHGDSVRSATSGGDPVLSAVDRLLAHVDELCARAPLVLVIDDLQWADDASVLMWHRLSAATRQLPLLLVAASRPAPDRVELAQLRRAVETRDDEVLLLTPLAMADTEGLVGELVGAKPGPGLRAMAARAFGNPLYLREVVDALVRSGAVGIVEGTADIKNDSFYEAPGSLVAAVSNRLDFLTESTREVLRRAALLGLEFAVAEVSATMGKPPSELLDAFEEGVASSVILEAGAQLAFRHPLLRQALYEGIPEDIRVAWHRRAAEALASTGAPVERVAEQLVAVPAEGDQWVVEWLAEHHERLADRAPLIAVDLLGRVLESCSPTGPHTEVLLVALVRVLHRLELEPEERAREALALASDPDRAAELRHILAAILHRRGETAAAVAILDGNDGQEVSELWRERSRSLLANFRRGDLTDLDETVTGAREALDSALESNERYPAAHALQTLWLVDTIRRDHRSALGYIDRALDVVKGGEGLAGLRFDLLDNQMFTLQNLDRLDDAESALREAREVAEEFSLPHGLQVSAAVQQYWRGHWDEALVELDTVTEDGPAITFHGLREPGAAALLLHGVAALISGRRGKSAEAAAHLDAADGYLPVSDAERESCDFLFVARALSAEQRGEPALAIELLAPILDRTYAQLMLRHQWLPDLTRLAVDSGDLACARAALTVCEEEADKEVFPARAAAAAARCRALVEADPGPMLSVASHYRTVGRRLEMASALEDAAVLLARRGRLTEARPNFDAAVEEFTRVGALWDIRRAESRMRDFGFSRAGRPSGHQAEQGWSSLSDVETKIATLVALGRSNPDIARELALPRRTVQAHVARVLTKLGANSRVGIVAEVSERMGGVF